ATLVPPYSRTIARAHKSSCLPVAMRLLPKPARYTPSYLPFELGSRASLPPSSSKGSPASHLPLWLLSVNFSPHTPVWVIVPSQSEFVPNGVIATAATPTFNPCFSTFA